MIGLTASTALFFTLATSNATTTTKDALAALDSCDPDKIDKIALKRSITAPGRGRDRR
jgi:hypothetical protein